MAERHRDPRMTTSVAAVPRKIHRRAFRVSRRMLLVCHYVVGSSFRREVLYSIKTTERKSGHGLNEPGIKMTRWGTAGPNADSTVQLLDRRGRRPTRPLDSHSGLLHLPHHAEEVEPQDLLHLRIRIPTANELGREIRVP